MSCGEEEEVAPTSSNYIGLEINKEEYKWEGDLVTASLDDSGFFLISGVSLALNTVQIYIFTDGKMPQSGETYEYFEVAAQDSGNKLSFANLTIGQLGFSTLALTASSPLQKDRIGQIAFTEVITDRCKGTFNFQMANVEGVITIENGEFDTPIND